MGNKFDNIQETIAERIKKVRNDLGYSQETLSEILKKELGCEFQQRSISGWESGTVKVPLNYFLALAYVNSKKGKPSPNYLIYGLGNKLVEMEDEKKLLIPSSDDAKDVMIKDLKQQIDFLKDMIKNKDRVINNLLNQLEK